MYSPVFLIDLFVIAQDSLEVGRNLVLTGSAPLVVIWKKPETGELQELLLTGALVDLNATLCKPT